MGFDEFVSVGGTDGGCVIEEAEAEAENRRPGVAAGQENGLAEGGYEGEKVRARSQPPRLPELKLGGLGMGDGGTGFGGEEMFRGIR